MASEATTTVDVSGLTGSPTRMQQVGRLRTEASSVGAYWTLKSDAGFYFDLVGQKIWYGGDGYLLDDNAHRNLDAKVKGDGYLVSLEVGQRFDVSSALDAGAAGAVGSARRAMLRGRASCAKFCLICARRAVSSSMAIPALITSGLR
jgi:type V secretory pathway adhesin AidA